MTGTAPWRFGLLVVGVGGQGALTAARIVGEAALRSGLNAVVGELHGMSQRGGAVEATTLIGPGRTSFLGGTGADAVLGLEPLETLRALPRMSGRTAVVVNLGRVMPFSLAQRGEGYPDLQGVLARIREACAALREVDGPALARQAGEPRSLNAAMLGALSGLGVLPVDRGALLEAMERLSPPRFREPNRRAFALGERAVRP